MSAEFFELQAIARSYQRSRALFVAADLGVADLLCDGPRAVDDLARATATDGPTLYRLLRALASIGVFHEDEERRFTLTSMGEYLRRDHPDSLDPVVRMFCADYEWRAWGALDGSVRTGENAAVLALGTDVWEHRRRHPADGETFDAAMRTLTRSSTGPVIAAHDFGRYGLVADIGGGTGALLSAVLDAHPDTRGILFDQPQVVANAELTRFGDRVQVRGGDFFTEVPGGADAYLLRRILHDWTDGDAARILGRIREAAAPTARLILVEAVVGPPGEDPGTKFLDLMMLVSAGGRERTEPEWAELLAGSDFRYEGATRATATTHVIEAVPV
jgi:O-methyltransferase domain/Dimerisation domain